MGSINPAKGPIPKPQGKKRGGKSPKQSGIAYERRFTKKYGHERVVGSGAFGLADPVLKGDVRAKVGDLDMLLELKSLNTVDGRGERTVTFPLVWFEKIVKQAESLGKIPGLLYHPKGSEKEYIFLDYAWFKEKIEDYTRQISELSK